MNNVASHSPIKHKSKFVWSQFKVSVTVSSLATPLQEILNYPCTIKMIRIQTYISPMQVETLWKHNIKNITDPLKKTVIWKEVQVSKISFSVCIIL